MHCSLKTRSHLQTTENDTDRLLKDAASRSADDEPSRTTIVHEIAKSNLPPEEKTLKRVFEEVVVVTGAGFETTSSILRLLTFYVWNDPKILGRLRAELAEAAAKLSTDGVSGQSQSLELRTLENLPYLTGVLMEGMRMSPALGTRMQRIAPDRDLTYNEFKIPAGTPVGMTTLDMHMNERLYPEPKRFIPERWIDPATRKSMEKVFAPFSRGTRICLGMQYVFPSKQ